MGDYSHASSQNSPSEVPEASAYDALFLARIACDLADWLKACSDELESEVIARYGGGHYDDLHPAMKRRFTRDMQSVVQSRALLRHFKDVIPDWPRREEPLGDVTDAA